MFKRKWFLLCFYSSLTFLKSEDKLFPKFKSSPLTGPNTALRRDNQTVVSTFRTSKNENKISGNLSSVDKETTVPNIAQRSTQTVLSTPRISKMENTTSNYNLASVENREISSEVFLKCLQRNETFNLTVDESSSVSLMLTLSHEAVSERTGVWRCRVVVEGPQGSSVSVLHSEQTCHHGNVLSVLERQRTVTWDGCKRWVSPGFDFLSSDEHVDVIVTLTDVSIGYKLGLNVRAVSKLAERDLLVRFVTPRLGIFSSLLKYLEFSQFSWQSDNCSNDNVCR